MEEIKKEKSTLVLHSCCGPCSTAVIEKLIPEYNITLFFYNPNITDHEEYNKRYDTQKKFVQLWNQEQEGEGAGENTISFIEGEYEPDIFLEQCRDLALEPEGGTRCTVCFQMRLKKTAELANMLGADFFCTTLSVSPHKDAKLLNEIGAALEKEMTKGSRYLEADFKKKDGYGRSVKLSKAYELYRQNYCGCQYSVWWK